MLTRVQQGFTLVELMVTISVLAILLSVGLPSFAVYIANVKVRATAQSISNGLQLARAEAVKHNQNVRFTLNNDSSWLVGCVTVSAGCPASLQAKPATEGADSKIVITRTGSDQVVFTALGTVSPTAGQLSQVNVDSNAVASARELSIRWGVGGNVKMCDPNIIVTTDPRKC